ncbi:MAG TPA: heme ABC transporter ATP-binding protein [Marinospirillum sp.]|uniref:heme ABC transporter ATP-binding protein n=1 Tax=Marinospirillum sp. TaxID=2183934 RepID=UPI002B459C79|nr:heme ABC transporter ATP-binding protein [Marinospirillum sp.]HKM15014.1 heme ABC transporter ATP-binding protein [Marinospirillum sp.]
MTQKTAKQPVLTAREISLGKPDSWRLQPMSLDLYDGQILAVCGPNGAGKSSLLSLLTGEIKATSGQVMMGDRLLSAWSPAELARNRARMEQSNPLSFDFLTEEVVALGRYAWGDDQADSPLVIQAMQAAGAYELLGRKITRLSGGERQRVQLARVLAQIWAVPRALLLLDEPMSAQDLGQQQQIFRQLKTLVKQHNWSLVCVLHDLNLASVFADKILLLDKGKVQALGKPAEVLDLQRISSVYKAELTAYYHPENNRHLVMLDD